MAHAPRSSKVDPPEMNDLADALFASPPLPLEELFDVRARRRIGELISEAMIVRTPRRRNRLR
jgi:hypothetical protein